MGGNLLVDTIVGLLSKPYFFKILFRFFFGIIWPELLSRHKFRDRPFILITPWHSSILSMFLMSTQKHLHNHVPFSFAITCARETWRLDFTNFHCAYETLRMYQICIPISAHVPKIIHFKMKHKKEAKINTSWLKKKHCLIGYCELQKESNFLSKSIYILKTFFATE